VTILFDFDGVILNSRENMRRSWASVQQGCGVTAPFEAYFEHIGKPFQTILSAIGVEGDRAVIERTYFAASSANAASLRLFPGVRDMLLALATLRTPIGILTSKDPVRTRQFVDQFSLPISHLYCPTPLLAGKPEPDLFHVACADWVCSPGDITYVGDMSVDEQAARGVGARYIHVDWGYGKPLTEFAQRVDTPEALLDVLVRRHAPALTPYLARPTISFALQHDAIAAH
jgi:HAD superfamily hydrolase (TIGR01549 family)